MSVNEYLKTVSKEDLHEIYELSLDNSSYDNQRLLDIYNAENEMIYGQLINYLPKELLDSIRDDCINEAVNRYFNLK